MAKLPEDVSGLIWSLKRDLLEILEEAVESEYRLFENYGETDRTIIVLEELKNVADRAKDWFSRLSNAQIRIAEAQPSVPADMLELVYRSIDRIEAGTPALKQSIAEVKRDWGLQ
jgi:hypothetical protein